MGVSNGIDEIDALEKIKDAKELLEMGAITQQEFENIKKKYLTQLNKSNDSESGIAHQSSSNSFLDDDEIAYDMVNDMADKIFGVDDSSTFKEEFIYHMRKDIEKTREDNKRPKISCPKCGKLIPDNATRCKHCNIMLNKYMLNNHSQNKDKNIVRKKSNKIVTKKKTKKAKPPLDENLQKRIEDNLDQVCNIFAIPNLGKKFVINKLSSEYTSDQITEKLNQYSGSPKKQSTVLQKIDDKKNLISNKICKIPENQLEIFFVISGRSPMSKKEFINTVQGYWSYETVKKFYDEYTLFLKQGFQEKDFKKVLEYDIEETYRIFSISRTKRMLGEKHTVKYILNTCSSDEIKNKLDSNFNIHE